MEDRLTESLAAVLEAAPDAAAFLVREWFGLTATAAPTVLTQRRLPTGERLDLELVFGPLNQPEARVWLEAKVGAVPTRRQVASYLESLGQLPGPGALSWLVPVGVEVVGGSPEGVREHTWQDLAIKLDEWRAERGEERDSFSVRLVGEYIRYLEELRLAVTHSLEEDDVSAIERYELAATRLKEIFRLAGTRINARRPQLRGGARPPRDIGFWAHVQSAGWPDTASFEWRATHDGLRHDPRGSFAVGAGVSWELGSEPSQTEQSEWFARRYSESFECGVSRRKMVYLLRYRTLTDLLEVNNLRDQADLLAEWALESWRMLEADPIA